MIITRVEFLSRTKLDQRTLDIWIEEEWLIPEQFESDLAFSEADIARVQLISDLFEEMGVNREGIGIILHLLDQVHGLRSAVASLLDTARNRAAAPSEKL